MKLNLLLFALFFLAGFLLRPAFMDRPDPEDEFVEEVTEAPKEEAKSCAPFEDEIRKLKAALAKKPKSIEKTVFKQAECPKPSQATPMAEKLGVKSFDDEYETQKKGFQTRLRAELQREVPIGEEVDRQVEPDGFVRVQETASDGTQIAKLYSPSGDLHMVNWRTPDGYDQLRRYDKEGNLMVFSANQGPKTIVEEEYGPDGKVIAQSFLSDKSGDVMGVEFDQEGKPISKWRRTKEGHDLNVWTRPRKTESETQN